MADGREDWYPRWLGRYKRVDLLLDRICDPCNQELGKELDQVMSRGSVEATNRYILGLKGRHGEEPANVFDYRAQSPDSPVRASSDIPATSFRGEPFEPLMEDLPGPEPRMRTWQEQLVFRDSQGGACYVAITPALSGKWLQDAIRLRGLGVDARLSDVVCTPEDEQRPEIPRRIRRALLDGFPHAQEQAQRDGINVYWRGKDAKVTLSTRATTTILILPEYRRAIAKLAFHYMMRMDKDVTGAEPAFAPLRDYIRFGRGLAEDFVDLDGRQFVIDRGSTLRWRSHDFFFFEVDPEGIIKVHLQFFLRGPLSGHPITVRIGRDPFVRSKRFGHCIRRFGEPIDGYDGELLSLEVGKTHGEWGVLTPPWMSTADTP